MYKPLLRTLLCLEMILETIIGLPFFAAGVLWQIIYTNFRTGVYRVSELDDFIDKEYP